MSDRRCLEGEQIAKPAEWGTHTAGWGDRLGENGASGNGRDQHWVRDGEGRCRPKYAIETGATSCVRLHVEVKTRPVLDNPVGGKACRRTTVFGSKAFACYGYTPNTPEQYGYRNPIDLLKVAGGTDR